MNIKKNDRKGFRKVLQMSGIEGRLLKAVWSFSRGGVAYVRTDGELIEGFPISVGVRQGYVNSP